MSELPFLGVTKTRMLRELTAGPKTAIQLASTLRIQASAVRKHLERLRAIGFVEARFERAGPGRPKKFYVVTDNGRELFPRRYDRILDALLTHLVRESGEKRAERTLRRIAADFARAVVPGPAPDRAHLRRLVRGLEDLGFEPSIAFDGKDCIITSRNCPILRTARAHRELVCQGLHEEILRKASGVPSVHRGKWIVDGDPICTHTLGPARP